MINIGDIVLKWKGVWEIGDNNGSIIDVDEIQ